MKNSFKNFIYHACGYSVLITLIFYAFAALSGFEEALMSFSRFALIVAFSLVISASELIFTIQKLKRVFCYLIHFTLLYLGFFVIFILISENKFRPSFILSSFIIFSALYLLITVVIFATNKGLKKSEIQRKSSSKNSSSNSKK